MLLKILPQLNMTMPIARKPNLRRPIARLCLPDINYPSTHKLPNFSKQYCGT